MVTNTERKIDLWKQINAYINKTEESYSVFFSFVITIIGAALTLLGSEILQKDVLFARISALILVPIALAIVLAYMAYNFRIVAIARMYATNISAFFSAIISASLITK